MALRLRQVDVMWLATGCNETPPKNGDIFIDDAQEAALIDTFAMRSNTDEVDSSYRELYVSEFDVDYFMENSVAGENGCSRKSAENYRDNYLNYKIYSLIPD